MIFNKIYFPVDAIDKGEDFQGWYEDGALFMSTNADWSAEKNPIQILAKTGAEMCKIKPDYKCLTYSVGVERFTYTLKTKLVTKHYYFEGMLWNMHGTPSSGHACFIHEDTGKKDVVVKVVDKFRDKGPCYEVKVRDITKLRVAVCAVIAILHKEHWKGASEGEPPEDKVSFFSKLRHSMNDTVLTYDEVMAGITTVFEKSPSKK